MTDKCLSSSVFLCDTRRNPRVALFYGICKHLTLRLLEKRWGESMFRDARSYFNSLTRNAEAFSQIASTLKDSIFLTDEELYSVICSHINKEYSVKTPSQLSAPQKIDTACQMHFGYNASNQQLRRMLRLDLSILEELFP